MKRKHSTKIILLFVLVTTFMGCSKEGFLDYKNIDHTSEWLFPIVKTVISAEQVSKLDDLTYDIEVLATDMPFLITGVPIPPISLVTIGPLPLQDTDSIYVKFRANEAILNVTITNNFPINIKSGTTIEIRNSSINNDVVFKGVIEHDITEKGGQGTVTVQGSETTPWIDNQLQLYFVDFTSDGSPVPVDITIYNNISLSLEVEIIELNEAELYGDISYDVSDTSKYTFGSEPEQGLEDSPFENALLNLFIENGIPLNYSIQSFFLDDNFNIIDSLFSSSNVLAPEIDAPGYVINSSIVEKKIVTEMSIAKYNNLRSRTRHINHRLSFSSRPQNVRIIHENNIKINLTAELKTKLDF